MLPAACAVRWYGIREQCGAGAEVTLLIHMPGFEADRLEAIAPLIQNQALSQGWRDVRLITESQMVAIVGPAGSHDDPGAIDRFRRFLGKDAAGYTEVYFSHLVCGHAAPLCLRAFPAATRITYGESMGLMEDKDYVLASTTGAGWDEATAHLRRSPEPDATKAVLILPADQTGDCLVGKDLLVVPRTLALQVIADFQVALADLGTYSRELLARAAGRPFVFIAANLSDVGIISPERESDMYVELIEKCAPPGSSIFIKAHPLSVYPIEELTAVKLRSQYDVHCISPEYKRYPMEIWADLLARSEVIALSYCAVSLEYLFGIRVHYPFDFDTIKRYIDERAWNRLRDGDEFNRQQREHLKSWDGQGVLCSGRRVSFPPTRARELTQNLTAAERKNQEGVALVQAGRLHEAIEIFKAGLVLAPVHGVLATNLGVTSWNVRREADAVTYLSLALLSEPDNRQAVLNLSHVLVSLGKREAAQSVCFGYLQRHADDAGVLELWGSLQS
jgi:hypothetical protein